MEIILVGSTDPQSTLGAVENAVRRQHPETSSIPQVLPQLIQLRCRLHGNATGIQVNLLLKMIFNGQNICRTFSPLL